MLSILLIQIPVAEASPLTVLSAPSAVAPTLNPGSIFRINITVAHVQMLHGQQFILSYNTDILTAEDFGLYLPFEVLVDSKIDDAEGYLLLAAMTPWGDNYGLTTTEPTPTSWIEFLVEGRGLSVLDLHGPEDGSLLCDVYGEVIPHEDVDGFFDNRLVMATVDIAPDTLNLKSRGQWITVYIELLEGYDVGDIDVSAVVLNDTIPVSLLDVPAPAPVPTKIGDYDNDGIPDLMVKFDRAMVESFIYNQRIRYDEVTLTLTGNLFDGTPFEGTDIFFVNYAGDVNNDGTVDILDAGMVSACWYPGPPMGPLGYDEASDFNKDGEVDIFDVGILSVNWAQITP